MTLRSSMHWLGRQFLLMLELSERWLMLVMGLVERVALRFEIEVVVPAEFCLDCVVESC